MSPPAAGRTFTVEHRVTHTVSSAVPAAYVRVLLHPREGTGQRVHRSQLTVSPAPREEAAVVDVDGNWMTYLHVDEPHQRLEVHATAAVTVTRRAPGTASLPQLPWDRVVAAVHQIRGTGRGDQGEGPTAVLGIVAAALPSELVEPDSAVLEYALPSFRPGLALVSALEAFAQRTSDELTVRPGRFDGNLRRIVEERTGTDEDITHLMCGALRAVGLSARYVSGYRYVEGSVDSAVRSWAAVWLPGGGWLHIDPVAGARIDDSYIVLGWGRDARDVAPLRGVVLSTGSDSEVHEHATLTPIDSADLWPAT